MKNLINNKYAVWLSLHSLAIIISSVFCYIFVETIANINKLNNEVMYGILLHAAGIILPMSVLLGILNYIFTKYMYRYVSTLALGIEKVSKGNYNIQLDINKGGPFAPVYENFNKMIKELQNTYELRNDFINNFSHEFKTPITSINGFANLILKSDVSEEDKNKYLKIIVEESDRLTKMANSTILLSKLNIQQYIYNKKPYSLDEQIRKCVILLSSLWSSKNIDITLDLQKIIYNGNEELMSHLWINLIENSIKYTLDYGKITIKLIQEKNNIIFKISDSGIGMDDETISRIFSPYYQGDKSHSTQGLGLGLSIVKRIVELCDGRIEVKSKKGKGSEFIILLPRVYV